MTTKIEGTVGITYPDASVQNSAGISQVNADTRYVNTAGDTMTGLLTTSSLTNIGGMITNVPGTSISESGLKVQVDGIQFARYGTNGANKAYVDATGGISCSGPAFFGQASTSYPATLTLFKSSADGRYMMEGYTDGTVQLRIDNSGQTILPSDVRFKNNVVTLGNQLSAVNAIRPVSYNHIYTPDKTTYGVIAQELKNVLPDLVHEIGDQLSVSYNGLIPVLIKAVQELSAKLDTALTRIAELEAK